MPSTSSPPSSVSLRFGPGGRFELQSAERRLLVDGHPAALGARALDLLITLAAQPDHLLSKSELLDRVWPGLVVEEANLQMQISNLRKLLGGDTIATVPGRGYRFVAVLQPVGAAPPPAVATAPVPRQRLFGRDADLARLAALLQRGGCVTLVGTSGVGKTSLARAAAAGWHGHSVWVDLASLTEGAQVAPTLARALGSPLDDGDPARHLLQALQDQTLLLVLDNAEHLIQTCAELATLLRPLPGVHLLVTSQLPLAVAGEQVQRLEPLALPGAATAELGDGALALLVERIAAADHRFSADATTLPLLAAVCTQLDGLPLALEMAAARVPLLGLQGVHDALAERFALLTRGHRDAAQRHRTLHGALDWSYRLLDAPGQRLFRALGVFTGGFTLDLAITLMTDDAAARWDVIDGLAALADRSLLVVGSGDPPRYRLLETVRAFALEQLRAQAGTRADAHADDSEPAVRRRHAASVLALFTRREPGPAARQAQSEAEMENAREAIAWAREHDLGMAAQLTMLVTLASNFTVWRQESTDWLLALEPLMETPAGQALPAPAQAAWWTELARMLSIRRDRRAAVVARRALALWAPLNDPRRSLFANVVWVRSVGAAGPELDQACTELQARAAALPDLSVRERLDVHGALVLASTEREDLEAVLSGRLAEMTLARELGLSQMVDAAESNVVFALNAMNRHAEAAERGRALLARVDAGSASTQGNLPWVLQALLKALVMLGQLDEAQALAPRAWSACRRFDTPVVVPALAQLAALQQRFEAAATLVGYARARFEARNSALGDADVQALVQAQAAADAALGAATAQALVHRGRSLDDADAAALALVGHASPIAAVRRAAARTTTTGPAPAPPAS